jgi:hypothetical protein
MASYNKVILMGHLTRDPEMRTLPNSDTQVCDFGLAVNRRWKDSAGEDREEVLFIDCAAFGQGTPDPRRRPSQTGPVGAGGRPAAQQDSRRGRAVPVCGPQAGQRQIGDQRKRQAQHQHQNQPPGTTGLGDRWRWHGCPFLTEASHV